MKILDAPYMQGNRRIAMVDTDTGAFMAALGACLAPLDSCASGFR